jgi:6-phosphogluconolactonase
MAGPTLDLPVGHRRAALTLFATISILIGLLMSPTSAATFVYVGNAESQDISVFRLEPTGDLAPVETTPIPGPAKPGGSVPFAISPDRQFLHVALRNEPYSVASFRIDATTGRLTALGSAPLPDSMAYVATDHTGRYLLTASYGGGRVAVSPIAADGRVGEAQQVLPTEPKAHAIITDPTNRYVLITSLGGNVIHQQRFDPTTGALTPNDPPTTAIEPKGGPRHLVFSPDARFIYLLNELDGTVHVLPWNAETGTLGQQVQYVSLLPEGFSGNPWGADIRVTPDGRYLYASERTGSTLAGFRIDPTTGSLTPIGTFATETQPRSFAIDPSGRYLLAVGELSNAVSISAIDAATGALRQLGSIPVGTKPNWVEIVDLP